MAIAWGLSFSTVLCLVVVPCVYRIFDDFSMLITRKPLASNIVAEPSPDLPPADKTTAAEPA